MPSYTLTVNGRAHRLEAEPETPLLWVLRDRLRLFGTKFGCGMGNCGACTILEGSRALRACTTSIAAAAGRSFTTIEGLSASGLHPCQRAWIDEDVSQCGFCQAGMIMEAVSLLARKPRPDDADIDAAFSGHVCRCGTYGRIRRAVHRAAGETR